MKTDLKNVNIYTDGACSGNPGPGGFGAILVYGDREKEISGGDPSTTNNRMELLAAITALEMLKEPCRVTLTSDSRYLVDAVGKGWAIKNRRSTAISGNGFFISLKDTASTSYGYAGMSGTRTTNVVMRLPSVRQKRRRFRNNCVLFWIKLFTFLKTCVIIFLQTEKRMLIKYYCGVSAVLFTCVFSYAKSTPCQSHGVSSARMSDISDIR